jgi:hypothetical protein
VITFLICAYESSLFLNAFGNLSSSRIRTNFWPLGAESAENPHSGIINTVSLNKPFAPKEKSSVVWYSHQCTPASHHSRCTSTANKIALRCSANPLVHTSIISLPLVFLLRKNPQSHGGQGENTMHEHRTNHQLCCHIRHLEHDLRDITARCCAERERRMSLEVVIGGEIFILI